MDKYRKIQSPIQSVEVEAYRFDGTQTSADQIELWSRTRTKARSDWFVANKNGGPIYIGIWNKNDVYRQAEPGDWVVLDQVKGFDHYYVMKDEEFKKTYEKTADQGSFKDWKLQEAKVEKFFEEDESYEWAKKAIHRDPALSDITGLSYKQISKRKLAICKVAAETGYTDRAFDYLYAFNELSKCKIFK